MNVGRLLSAGGPISGLADCHIPGLYSIALRARTSHRFGMVRVFYAGPESRMSRLDLDGDFFLMPHNHRQDITLYRLFGAALNVDVELNGVGDVVHEYEFGSAILDGKFSLTYRRAHAYALLAHRPITHDGIRLRWDEVHTVLAQPESAWLVAEGELAPSTYISRAFSRRPDKQLSATGLYRPLSPAELKDVYGRIRGMSL